MSARAWVKRVLGESWLSRLLAPMASSMHYLFMGLVIQGNRRDLRRVLAHCGSDFEIYHPWDIRGAEYVSIGDKVFLGPGVLMIADKGGEIQIGNNIMFGPRVTLIAFDHRTDDPNRPMKESGYGKFDPIVISDDVWVGAGATILRGVKIGKGTVVGAGAVLTKSTGENELWGGNPARKIKDRFSSGAAGR